MKYSHDVLGFGAATLVDSSNPVFNCKSTIAPDGKPKVQDQNRDTENDMPEKCRAPTAGVFA